MIVITVGGWTGVTEADVNTFSAVSSGWKERIDIIGAVDVQNGHSVDADAGYYGHGLGTAAGHVVGH